MKKVFVISHALTEPPNQERWFELAKLKPDWSIYLLIPGTWISTWFGDKKVTITEAKKENNLEILPFNATHKSKWTLYLNLQLPFLLRKYKPDYIFCFQEEGTVSLCWSLLCKSIFLPESRIGFFSWQNIEIHRRKWHQRFRWWLTKKLSDFFIAGTQEIKQLFKQNDYQKPIYVQTEIGVSPKVFKRDDEQNRIFREKYCSPGKLILGYAGRLVPEKGIFDLANALDSLHDIPFQMIWAGDGNEMEKLKKLRPDDVYLGFLNFEEMIAFYNGIDLLILPSKTTPFWKEQFGLVIAQALACETPVLGSSSGAIPEVINNMDYIFEEGDSEDLAQKIRNYEKKNLSPFDKGLSFRTPQLAEQTVDIITHIDNGH
jgi:glycosyltransferase involved in cell wall biosynthesis